MDFKELFDDIKRLVNKFNKNLYFHEFDKKSVFINVFTGNDTKYMLRFNNEFYGKYKSIEIFYNQDGFNYLSDSFYTPIEYEKIYELDGFVLMYLPSDSLTMDEGKYIHNLKYKIKKEDNLLIYKYTYGKGRKIPTEDELLAIFDNLEFIDSLIKEEGKTLFGAFENGKSVFSSINKKELNYEVSYIERPISNYNIKFQKANESFIEEHKDSTYFKEAYLYTSYYPMVIKETNVRPLVISYIVPNKKINVRYITTARNTYKDVIFGILDDIFDKVGVLPERLELDNRDLFGALKNTLDALNIEYSLVFNPMDPFETEINPTSDINKKPGLCDDPTDIQPREAVETFLSYMVSAMKNFDFSDIDTEYLSRVDEDDDFDDNSNLDSDTDLVA